MNAPKRTKTPKPAEPVAVVAGEAIRETFAALFPYSPLRDSLRHLGVSLAEWAKDVPSLEEPGEATQVEIALRAAATDLRHAERFLAALGRQASDRKLTPGDRQLARQAGRLVVRVAAVAQAIEETVDAAQAARRAEGG